MSIQNALNFYHAVQDDRELRRQANNCASGQDFDKFLEEKGYKFTPLEWENATTQLLFKAADEDEAEEIKAMKMWCEWHWHT